jgi:hypothetical protein
MSTVKMTPHEHELLPKAIAIFKEKPEITQDDLKRELSCSSKSATVLHRFVIASEAVKRSEKFEKKHEKLVETALIQTAVGDKPYQNSEEYLIRENARLSRNLSKVKLDLDAEKKMRVHLSENHAGYDELLEKIQSFVKIFGDHNIETANVSPMKADKRFKPPVGADHTEDAVLLLSDTHYGDVIRDGDTSGFPEYDLFIGANRTGYVAEKACQVLSLHRAMYPIKNLHVWFGGDIGNGELHDSPNSNALSIAPQIHFSYHMLKFVVQDLLKLVDAGVVEHIILYFTVGNHMRYDIFMPHKYQAQRTFDWLIYQMLIEKFDGDSRITVQKAMSPYIFADIRGHRHLFAHGMQVGYVNKPEGQAKAVSSFIAGVRALFDSPVYRKKVGLEGETFSRACIGDIHVPIEFPRLIANGSLNGQNELGVNWTLEPIPAGQVLFGVSDKHQQTWKYFLDCTHVQRENPNPYAKFAEAYDTEFGR